MISGDTAGAQALTPAWADHPERSRPPRRDVNDGSHDTATRTRTTTTARTPTTPPTGALGVLTGENIGDLLNTTHVSWGWFQGGFAPTSTRLPAARSAAARTRNIGGASSTDYSPHHNPFEYYASTANPDHLAPTSLSEIGYTDQANHQYDLSLLHRRAQRHRRRHAALGVLPQGAGVRRTATPATPTRSTSRRSSSTRSTRSSSPSTGRRPRSSSPTTTRTAGTTTRRRTIVNGSQRRRPSTPRCCTSVAVTVGTTNGRCGYSQRLPMRRDLAVHAGELRQQQPDQHRLGGEVHRGQLAARRAHPRLVRRDLRLARRAGRRARLLHLPAPQAGHPQPDDRRRRQRRGSASLAHRPV